MFLESDIPRKNKRIRAKIVSFVGLLSKGVSYENGYISSRMKFGSIVCGSGDKT